MERNITNLLYDIQRLDRDIRRNDDFTNEILKFYVFRSNMLRKLLDKIVDNQKSYPSFVVLNLNEQKELEKSYLLLNQIDLKLNNLQNIKYIYTDKKIPFSFRSLILIVTSVSIIILYYKIFVILLFLKFIF